MKKTARKTTGKLETDEVPARFAAIAAVFSKDRKVTREKGWGSGNVVLKLRERLSHASQRQPCRETSKDQGSMSS